MAKFNITLTKDNGQVETLALNKLQLAHILAGPTISNCKLELSNDDLETAFSIIKLGIINYKNTYHNIKQCTIDNRYNMKIEEHEYNTFKSSVDNYKNLLYNYILDASIEYHFNIIKSSILYQYELYIKTGINTIDTNKLRNVILAISAKLDMIHFNRIEYQLNKIKYQPFFNKDDILAIQKFIDKNDDNIGRYQLDVHIEHILSYFNDKYIPYHEDLYAANNAYNQLFKI